MRWAVLTAIITAFVALSASSWRHVSIGDAFEAVGAARAGQVVECLEREGPRPTSPAAALRTFLACYADSDSDGAITETEILNIVRDLEGESAVDSARAQVRVMLKELARDIGDRRRNSIAATVSPGVAIDDVINLFHRSGGLVGTTLGDKPQQIHLALGDDEGSAVISWVTFSDVPSEVQIGTTAGSYDRSVSGESLTYDVGILGGWHGHVHRVTVDKLPTNTVLHYRVGGNDSWSSEFTFRLKSGEDTLSFASYGDQGTFIPAGYKVCKMIHKLAKEKPVELLLNVGDLCYAGTGAQYEWEPIWDVWGALIEPIAARMPYMVAVGNHEKYYNFTSYRTRYPMPSRESGSQFWYSFDYGPVHFIQMSTEHDYAPGSEQYKWIESDLARARARDVPWIVMSGHRPMYCSDAAEYDSHRPGAPFQQQIEPLMRRYGVDLYLAGHMHSMDRTHPIANGTVSDMPQYIDGIPTYKDAKGTVFLTIGNGGVFLDSKMIDPQPEWSALRWGAFCPQGENAKKPANCFGWGFAHFDVTRSRLHYSMMSSLNDNEVVDEAVLVKSGRASA